MSKKTPKTPKETKEPKSTKGDKDSKDTKDQKSVKKLVKRMLPCKLDQAALAKLGQDLSANLDKIAALEENKKATDKAINGDIALLEEGTSLLRDKIRSKSVEREVECEEVTDYRANEVRVIRLDTKEEFSKRTLTREELQLPLDAQKPAGKLLAMDGGKGKLPQIPCPECKGAGQIPFGENNLLTKCEGCDGTGKVDDKEPLKAKLGDVAAQHAKNKADADTAAAAPAGEGDGHPEVERMIADRKKPKTKKNSRGDEVDVTPPPGGDF
jgi:hypothetical protein